MNRIYILKNIKAIASMLIIVFIGKINYAQDGSIDVDFVNGASNGTVAKIAAQSDGRIIAVGNFTGYNGKSVGRIVRLNANGTFDNTFNPSGTGASGEIKAVKVLQDGSIIIGGDFSSYNGTNRNNIAKLTRDGALDITFNPGSGTNSTIFCVAVQSDGKLLIGGDFSQVNGSVASKIARLNSNGSFDNGFNTGNGFDNIVHDIVIQSDGKILAGGAFTKFNNADKSGICRINRDGSIDNSLNIGAGIRRDSNFGKMTVYSLLMDNNKILVGGDFDGYNDESSKSSIIRINSDGSLDNIFTAPFYSGIIYGMQILPDRKILIAGDLAIIKNVGSFIINCSIARLNENGVFDISDLSFRPRFRQGTENKATSLLVKSDGSIYIAEENTVVGLNKDGLVNPYFNDPVNRAVSKFEVLSDRKILAVGSFFDGEKTKSRLMRLSPNGAIDESFENTITDFGFHPTNIKVLKNGKIIVAMGEKGIVRMNADGQIDNTFNPSSGINRGGAINVIVEQPDGKIIIGGRFSSYNDVVRNNVARINQDGTLDNTFNVGTGPNGEVEAIQLQPDKKILIGGRFERFNSRITRIARLNENGSEDGTFIGSPPFEYIKTIAITANGNYLVGGRLGGVFGSSGILMLNGNTGQEVRTFVNIPREGSVEKIILLSGGKIYISGSFERKVIRLNADGGQDATYNQGVVGFEGGEAIIDIEPVSPYSLLVAGRYGLDKYNGQTVHGLVKVKNTLMPQQSINFCSTSPAKPTITISSGVEGVTPNLTLTSSVQAPFYQWFRNGTAIAGAAARSYTVQPGDFSGTAATTFTVRAATDVAGNCSATSDAFTLTANEDEKLQAAWQAYPNPTLDRLTVKLDAALSSRVQSLTLYDLQGRRVDSRPVRPVRGSATVEFDLRQTASGLLLLRAEGETLNLTKKIQKIQ